MNQTILFEHTKSEERHSDRMSEKMLTKRNYIITFIEGNDVTTRTITLNEIIREVTPCNGNAYEYFYAINEEIDKILDLKLGEHFRMKFNRDNFDSQGVIKRIN